MYFKAICDHNFPRIKDCFYAKFTLNMYFKPGY